MASKKDEIKVKFKADTKEFSDSINRSSQDISTLKSKLRLVDSEMKNTGMSVSGLTERQSLLIKEQEAQKNKTKAINSQLQVAKKRFGDNSEEVARLTKKLNNSKTAEQKIEKEIKDTNASLKEQKKQMGLTAEQSEKLKNGLDKIGNTSGVVAAGVGTVVAGTVKMASEFEDSLAKVDTLAEGELTKYNGHSMSMKSAITELSTETGKSVNEIAESVYQAMSSGQDASNAVAFVAGNLKLAKGGFTEVEKATDITTTILNAYKMEAKDASRVSDILIQTQNKGKTTVDQLASSMGNVIPTAKAQNVNLENVATSYAIMTANGVNTARTTTNLRSLLDELSDSSKASAIALKNETGKSFKELMASGYSLGDCLDVLQKYAKKNDIQFEELFKKSNARSGALVLMANGADGFNESLKTMESSTGSTDDAVDRLQTTSTKFNKSLNKIKNTGLEIGGVFLEELTPYLDEFGNKSEELTKYASEHMDDIVDGLKTIGIVSGTVFAVNKITKFGRSIADVTKFTLSCASSYKKLILSRMSDTAATSAQTAAQVGLNTAMKAGAIGLAVTGAAALAIAIYNATKKTEELTGRAKELRDEYDEFNKSVDEVNQSVESQFANDEKLIADLDEVFDKNGKVKEGYEDRAKVIQNELAESYGIEIEINKQTGKSIDKLKKKIKSLIETEKLRALIEQNEDNYNEAVQNQTEASLEVANKKQELDGKKENLDRLKKEFSVYEKKGYGKMDERTQEWQKYTAARIAIDTTESDIERLEAELESAQEVANGYADTIKRVDEANAALASGNAEKINESIVKMNNTLRTAENSSREILQKQAEDADANWKKLKKAYKDGVKGVTKEAVDEAKILADLTQEELDEYDEKFEKTGESNAKSYGKGWSNTKIAIKLGTPKLQGNFQNFMLEVDAYANKTPKVDPEIKAKIDTLKKTKQNAIGNIVKKPILTTFAENGWEAAIPINNKPRSKALWLETGRLMGMFDVNSNRVEMGNVGIQAAVDMSETNALLRTIAKKDSNTYLNGRKVSEAVAPSMDTVNGTRMMLAGRGCAYD